MANDDLDSFLRRASNYYGGTPEYYEDTHDNFGNYKGSAARTEGTPSVFGSQSFTPPPPPPPQKNPQDVADKTEQMLSNPPKLQYYDVPAPEKAVKAVPLPKMDQYISPRLYQNIVLYSPKTSNDVERLIDYLRRREPAIVDLDPISESPDAQRVLDFTSGAVYALNGRIIEIKTNTFLIVPEGIDVAKPEGN